MKKNFLPLLFLFFCILQNICLLFIVSKYFYFFINKFNINLVHKFYQDIFQIDIYHLNDFDSSFA